MLSMAFAVALAVVAAALQSGGASVGTAAAPIVQATTASATTQASPATVDALVSQLASYQSQQDALVKQVADLLSLTQKLATDAQNSVLVVQAALEAQLAAAENSTARLVRQVSMQQLFLEERIRSDGNSGVKRARGNQQGSKAYYSNKLSSASATLAIHDHSNYDRTPGLGEFIAVLNGVEFRTRHNDYKIVMPGNTSADLSTQPIPFPGVPVQVLTKSTVQDQVAELREWFRAFNLQNTSIRDYRPYFKPVMCYLEGSWTQSSGSVDEPFSSERHFIDANSWIDLTDKIEFTSYTGRKSILEDYAFLPTKIIDFINNTIPLYAQWNYRILCHPISFDVPLKALQVVDELSVRARLKLPYSQLPSSSLARFRIGPSVNWSGKDQAYSYNSLVDQIMREIPGRDNYGANIADNVMYSQSLAPGSTSTVRNAAYYSRWSSLQQTDAMGLSLTRSGFNDDNLFVALTTQPKIASKSLFDCYNYTYCNTFTQRATYAIPLEIIYLNPLQSWNPYNLTTSSINVVTQNGARTGEAGKPYNGTNPSKYYYMTPVEFFNGYAADKDPANTNQNNVNVVDRTGVVRNVTASGIRIFLPQIPGVGAIRQRYPVYPAHEEGSYTFMEVEAIKDILMDQNTFGSLYRQTLNTSRSVVGVTPAPGVTLFTSLAPIPSPHVHSLDVSSDDIAALRRGQTVSKVSSVSDNHNHVIQLSLMCNGTYIMVSCDGSQICWDGSGDLSTISDL